MTLRIGTFPTPIESLDARLWVKRDDLVAPVYGGNKVRKLEHLLAEAKSAGKSHLVTIGAAGSHQVVATAVYGRREGFETEAVVVAQPASAHGEENLRVALAHGLRPIVARSWAAAPALIRLALEVRSDAYLVPLGGSNALGSLGFVDAAKELAAQVAAGAMPEPDVIVVALGSGGTAAGLAVGLEATRLRTRVLGVAISPPVRLVEALARRLVKKTAALAGISPRAADRLEVDRRWLGRGYGYSTRDGDSATEIAARHGLVLDAAYTAKAFACALDHARSPSAPRVLYWHTLSSAPMASLLEGAPARLPEELARLFHA